MTSATDKINDRRISNLEYQLLELGQPSNLEGHEIEKVETTDPGVWEYFADFVVSFGQRVAKPGVGVFVNRLWANEVLIFDRTGGFAAPSVVPTTSPPNWPPSRTVIEPPVSAPPSPVPGNAPGLSGFTFFDGDEEQGEVFRGMHYRGLMVGRFLNFNLTDYGNRIPSITAELVDGSVNDPDNNIGGDIYFKYPLQTYAYGFHPEADSLYRGFYRYTTSGYTLNVDKARLSTKSQSFEIQLRDADYAGGNPPSSDYIRDLQMAFIPALNYAVGQSGSDPYGKRLHDLSTGATLSVESGYPWQGCIAFRVTSGSFSDWLVMGAASEDYGDYPFSGFLVKGGLLYPSFTGTLTEPAACLTVGKEYDGSTDIYVTTASKVQRYNILPPGSGGGLASMVSGEDFYAATGGDELRQCWYDPVQDRIIVLSVNGGVATARSLDNTGAVIWTSATFTPPLEKTLRGRTQESRSNVAGGSLMVTRDVPTEVTYIDLVTGFVEMVDIPNNGTNAGLMLNWDSGTKTLYSSSPRYVAVGVLPEASVDPGRYTAAEVMRAYATFAGYEDDNIVTTGMDQMFVDGYVVSGQTTLGGLSSGLGTLYGFDWSERAGVITFKNNYNSDGVLVIDETVAADRLAKLANTADEHFAVVRTTDTDYPAIMSLAYFDIENDYKPGYQVARRNGDPTPTMASKERADLSLPLTIDGDYALELLYQAIYRVWATKLSYTVRLPSEYMVLDAGDAISFTADNVVYQATVTQSRINTDYTSTLTLNEAAGNSYPVQLPTQPPVAVPPKGPQPVRAVVLDLPSQAPNQNGDRTLNLWVLLAGYKPGTFRGAAFDMTAADDPTGWVTLAAVGAAQEAYIGSLTEELGTWENPFVLDDTNALTLDIGSIPEWKLVDADEDELDAGANLIVVGEGSQIELIQFGTVEDLGAGIWRLTDLRRGRFGTDVYVADAMTGTTVAFLDNAQIVTYTYDQYLNDTQFLYRAYSPNQPKWQVDAYPFIADANSRKPYAPINVTASRDDIGDITFEWTRRARFYNSPPTDFDTPPDLDEITELYEVHVFLPDDTIRVIRAETGPYAIYTIDEQSEDALSGTETELPLAVYQVSAETIGLGFGNPTAIPIYAAGAALLSMDFAGGGGFDFNVLAGPVELSMTFGAGGSFALDIEEPTAAQLIEMTFGGGGSFEITPRVVHELSMAFAGGGDLEMEVEEPAIPFDVTDLPALATWYDASDSGTISLVSVNQLNTITDKSGAGRTGTGGGSGHTRPTVDATALNGHPGIVFVNTGFPNQINATWDTTTDAMSITFAFKTTFAGGNATWYASTFMYGADAGGVANDMALTMYQGKATYTRRTATNGPTQTTAVNDGNLHALTVTCDASGNVKFYVDGVLDGTGTTDANTINAISFIYIGRAGWEGIVGEVIKNNAELTSTEVADLAAYLLAKWS